MARINLAAGLVIGAVALVYLWQATQLPQGAATFGGVGPRAFPLLIGSVLLVVTGVLVLTSVFQLRKDKPATESPGGAQQPAPMVDRYRHVIMLLVTIAYLAILEPLGFLIATAIYLPLGLLAVDGTQRYRGVRALVPLAFGVVTATVVYLGFDWGLSVTLPEGVFAPRWW
jgi:putative tricarboxylic transport membrane protein